MQLTALRSGKYIVSVNGIDVSSHLTEREAIESALAQEADLVDYRHEYVVRVDKRKKKVGALLNGMLIGMNTDG